MADKLVAVKGMNDILPGSVPRKDKLPDSAIWRWFERTVESVLGRHGYQHLMTPIVEPTALFVRGIGEATDIVEKEMYSWEDAAPGDHRRHRAGDGRAQRALQRSASGLVDRPGVPP
jgi:histidyl-tRNA synthetase